MRAPNPHPAGHARGGASDPEKGSLLLVVILAAYSAAGPAATQIFLPALPALQSDFGVTTGVAQLSLSLSLLTMAVMPLAFGPWSDHIGRRPVAILGVVLYIGGSALCFVAPDILMLIAGRAIQAGGGACGLVLARAIIRDVYGADRSGSMISIVTMAMALAPMISPVIGGVLTDQLGWRSTFLFTALVGLVILVLVVVTLRESLADRGGGSETRFLTAVRALARQPMFHVYAFQGAFSMGIFFAFISSAPYVVVDVLERPATVYGFGFLLVAAGYIAGSGFSARYAQRIGIDGMMLYGTLVSSAAIAVMAALLFAGMWNVWAIFIPGMVSAAGNGAALPNAAAGAANVDPRLAGTASGAAVFLQLFMGAAVAQAVGVAIGGTPYPMAASMALMSLLALATVAAGRLVQKPAGSG